MNTKLSYKIEDKDHLLELFTHINRHLTIHERAIDNGFREQNNQAQSPKIQNSKIQNIKDQIQFEDFQEYFQRSLPKPIAIPTRLIGEMCSICQDAYLPQQRHYHLNCQHHFHQNCLEEWFKSHKYSLLICPLCRTDYSS